MSDLTDSLDSQRRNEAKDWRQFVAFKCLPHKGERSLLAKSPETSEPRKMRIRLPSFTI